MGWLDWNAYRSRVEIYEHGETQPRRRKVVRFDQFVHLQANRHLSRLVLHSANESSAQTISFWGTSPRIHPDNDRLLELLAQPLALNWLNHLREGRPVDWTPELRLHPRELELIHRDWWGNNLSERETCEDVLLYKTKYLVTFSHSHAMMLPPGEWFSRVLSVQVLFRAPNFLVGWLLLTWIRQMPELLTRNELAPWSLHVHPRSDS
jgi:hypothetical protein